MRERWPMRCTIVDCVDETDSYCDTGFGDVVAAGRFEIDRCDIAD